MILADKKALIIVDMQHDFVDGSLAVPGATHEKFISDVLAIAEDQHEWGTIVATKDWHPYGHVSFGLWPKHCIRGTHGAEIVNRHIENSADLILHKGVKKNVDAYSAFMDLEGTPTGLKGYLSERDVYEVHVIGLATDYCVLQTATDAVRMGFKTFVHKDLVKAVDPKNQDFTLKKMQMEGIVIV